MKKDKRHEDHMVEVLKGLTKKQLDKLDSFDALYEHVMKTVREDFLKEKSRKK